VAPALLGRVIASYRVIGLGGVPVGAFLGGFLARATSIRTTMAAAAALLAVVAVGMVVTVRRIPPEHR
jgi:predicted MFS family arabinose efflux permease